MKIKNKIVFSGLVFMSVAMFGLFFGNQVLAADRCCVIADPLIQGKYICRSGEAINDAFVNGPRPCTLLARDLGSSYAGGSVEGDILSCSCETLAQCNKTNRPGITRITCADSGGNKCCVISSNTGNANYGMMNNCSSNFNGCAGDILNCACSTLAQCNKSMSDTTCAGGTNGGNGSNLGTLSFTNPLKFDSLSSFLVAFMDNIKSLVALLTVVMMVLGGVFYVFAGANPKLVERAKACWTAAAIGFAIVISAPSFLKEIGGILGLTDIGLASVDGALTLSEIAMNVLNFLLSVIGILAIIMMVIGGGMMITDYGSEKRMESGKKMVEYAVVGLTVALSSLILIKQIGAIIGG